MRCCDRNNTETVPNYGLAICSCVRFRARVCVCVRACYCVHALVRCVCASANAFDTINGMQRLTMHQIIMY